MGYSLWGCKESDMTEQLSLHVTENTDQKTSLRNFHQYRGYEQSLRVLKCPPYGDRVGIRFLRREKQLQTFVGVRDPGLTYSWVVGGESNDER